jgi:hypothetical protein
MRRTADSEVTDLRVITERGEEELVVQQKRQIVMPAQLVKVHNSLAKPQNLRDI